jgi:hypothetical protein
MTEPGVPDRMPPEVMDRLMRSVLFTEWRALIKAGYEHGVGPG